MPEHKSKRSSYHAIHHHVFWPSLAVIILFIVVTLLNHKRTGAFFSDIQTMISVNTGWLMILVVNILLIFCLYLAFGKYANIRLGGPRAKPEFSTSAWFAMLFSAGMGIGLLFWSVAEPISHYANPPTGTGMTPAAAQTAMNVTFLHWGLHAWGIYALVGLALAYFTFNRKLPLTISSLFHPILGKHVNGPIGHIIDTLAVIATLFGLATSLGLGARQINAGLHFLLETEISTNVQIFIIAGTTLVATASVVLGLKNGVRRLSELNMYLAAAFLAAMLLFGPTLFIIDSFVQNTGSYIQQLPRLSFWAEAYKQTSWQNDWTIFYWGWWIAWSPFVGMFIARISKGRTIRQFVLGVLLVPTLLTFIWLSTFGGAALHLQITGMADIVGAVNDNVATALFKLLAHYPYAFISSTIGLVLICSFFVTSSDSGSLVIDSITSGGRLDAPVGQRIFWALTEGVVAAILLIGGGLQALQTASITTGLPFAVVLLVVCYCLYKELNKHESPKKQQP
ncbi:MAG: BCCT family transporter [Flavobacteriales bacterium]|nr:BCCT family transporter [Flavobacteriales bacterium]